MLLLDAAYLIHYDIGKRKRLGMTVLTNHGKLKTVIWNHDGSLVALILTKVGTSIKKGIPSYQAF